ncbi:hypothetical protein ABZ769_23400 [Streptomyces olivoreticuli]
MQLTVITLTAAEDRARQVLDGAQVAAAMWAAADAEDRLEHISTRSVPGHFRLGIFTAALPEHAAVATALGICHRALATSPLLRGWSVAAASGGPRPPDRTPAGLRAAPPPPAPEGP